MKIGIINPITSTGGWNYLYHLVKAMKKIAPSLDITIFTQTTNDKNINILIKNLKQCEIKIEKHQEYKTKTFEEKNTYKLKILNKIINKVRLLFFKLKHSNTNDKLYLKFDLIFYPWPYSLEPASTKVPTAFIAHDFILSHIFGSSLDNTIYTRQNWNNLRKHLKLFFDIGVPIVSTPFIKKEIKKIFPEHAKKTNVIYLSKFNDFNKLSNEQIQITLKKYQINHDYILCANNAQLHKNLGQVISAYYYIKQKHPNIKLIITGEATENITGQVNNPYYGDFTNNDENYDIKSLGKISLEDFSAILQGAKMVINASLCEAGAGSALDAWPMEIPVAMSNIPSFKQQLDYLGTKAELFDPRNSQDIAKAVMNLLDNPDLASKNAIKSKEAIDKYTWANVAQQYLNVFNETIRKGELNEQK